MLSVNDVRDVAREMMGAAGLHHPKWVLCISEAAHVSVRVSSRGGHIHIPKAPIQHMDLAQIHTMMAAAINIAAIDELSTRDEPKFALPQIVPKTPKSPKSSRPTVVPQSEPQQKSQQANVPEPTNCNGLELYKKISGKYGTYIIWRDGRRLYVIENAVTHDKIETAKVKDAFEIARHAANRVGRLMPAEDARMERLGEKG